MKKFLSSLLALTFFLPVVASAQVFRQSQEIIKPYGAGVIVASSTNGSSFLEASTAPTVNYITATSTSASSTFQNTQVNQLKIGTLAGILKAVSGFVTTALVSLTADVTGILPVANGGTNAASFTGGNLVYGNSAGTALTNTGSATTSASCSGTVSCTAFTVIGPSPITITGSGGATSAFEIATTSDIAINQLTYLTKTSGRTTLASVATTTFTPSAEFTVGGTIGAFVGGANSTLTLATNGVALTKLAQAAANTILGNNTGALGNVVAFATSTLGIAISDTTGTLTVARGGTGTTTAPSSQLLYGGGAGVYQSVATSAPVVGTGLAYSGTAGAFVGGTGGTLTATLGTTIAPNELVGQGSFATAGLLYPNMTSGQFVTAATTSVSCSGSVSCSTFNVLGSSPITITGTGGGSGVSSWATTTSTVAGDLINYSLNTTDIVAVGGTATTSAEYWFDPNTNTAQLGNAGSGDSTLQLGPTSNEWSFGYDDTDKSFAIASSTVLGTNNALTIDKSLNVTLANALHVSSGGTGAGTFTSGQLLYGAGTGAFQSVATTSVTCTGNTTCTSFTVLGSSPITINSTGGGGSGGGSWATTTSTVPGELVNYSLNNSDIISIGSNSTTTAKAYFDPNIPSFVLQGTPIASTTAIVCKTVGQCQYNTIGAAISAGERDIFVKDGTYSEKVTVANTKTKLRAQSLNTIIQCNGSTQSPCVSLLDESTLDGFTLNETNAQLRGVAISASEHSLTKIINNRVNNFATSTQYLDTTNATFYNTNSGNTYFNTGTCWEFGGTQANSNWISNNRCRPVSDVDGTFGAYVVDARGLAFTMNDVEGTTTGKASVGYYFDATSRDDTVNGGWDEALGTGVKIASGANNISFFGTTITSHGTDISDLGTNSSFLAVNRTGTKLFQLPSLTIGSLSGLLKAASGVVSVATAGTDYIAGGAGAATTTLGGGSTGLSFSNSPVVFGASPSALSGTLVVANGGTGTTTSTSGQVYYAGGAGVFQSVGTSSIANGTNITVTNGGSAFVLGAQPTINLSGVVAYANGGTGSTTAPQGQLLYGGATAYQSVATTSVTCSGTVSCSGFTVIGSSPITLTGSASGGSGLATTSPTNGGELLYYSAIGAGSAKSVATTSLTASAPIALSQPISVLGSSASAITCTNASSGVTGCLTGTDWNTFNGKLGSYDAWTHAVPGSSATTSFIGIGSTTPFSQLSVSSTTAGNAATSMFAIASNTNATLFNVLGSGNVGVGTTSPGTLFSIQGSANFTTGTSTILGNGLLAPRFNATATSSFAGVQISTGGLSIGSLSGLLKASSGNVLTAIAGTDYVAGGAGAATTTESATSPLSFTANPVVFGASPITLSLGTVGYANGGTGSTTGVAGQVPYYGTTAMQSLATSTLTIGTGVSYSGTSPLTVLGGTSGTLTATLGTTIAPNELVNQATFATAGLLYPNMTQGQFATAATTSVTCSGTVSCTTFAAIGPSPITISGSGGGTPGGASSTVQVNTNGTFGSFSNFFANGTYVGVGTTTTSNTQYFPAVLTAATSTAPQLALSDGVLGDSSWVARAVSNSFFLATTTTQGLATSTLAAFSIDKNGIPRFPSIGTTTVSSLAVDGNGVIAATSTMTLIATGAFPAANSVNITGIPAGYNHLILQATGYVFDTATRQLSVQFSVDNGSTFDATTANYSGFTISGTTVSSLNGPTAIQIATNLATGDTGSTTAMIYGYQGQQGSVLINGHTQTTTTGAKYTSETWYQGQEGSGKPINAIKLLLSNTGNFTGGTYYLYGVR